jgi:hypothetical protein
MVWSGRYAGRPGWQWPTQTVARSCVAGPAAVVTVAPYPGGLGAVAVGP